MSASGKKSLAIILLSGGMDSLVTAAIAAKNHIQTAFLHIDYGQRTEKKERECFLKLVDFYNPAFNKIIELRWLGKMGGSALTDKNIPISENGIIPGKIPQTYVPFRNTNFLSAAVAWAEVINASAIYYGAVEADSSGYPDCRIDYVKAFNRLINQGTAKKQIEVKAPVIDKSKREIVELGVSLGTPFQFSWSCYQNSTLACGKCDSCLLRLKAFKEAGLTDPIPYSNN